MNFFGILLIVFLSIIPQSSYADCGGEANDLDKECNKTQCGGTEEQVKGCYLPPEPGQNCPLNYPNHVDICCCK